MQKRKPFFIKENVQLQFITSFIVLLVLGIGSATIWIYYLLRDVLEEITFSAHLPISSSGVLFQKTIVEANIKIAIITIFIGLVVIIAMHVYLNKFFGYLAHGLYSLAKGDFSFHFRRKKSSFGKDLVDEYNAMVEEIERKMSASDVILKDLKQESQLEKAPSLERLKSLNQDLHKMLKF